MKDAGHVGLKILVLSSCFLIGGLVAAQSCPLRYEIRLADQQRACITDFPIARQQVPGASATIADLLPRRGVYDIAVSKSTGDCPETLAIESSPYSRLGTTLNNDIPGVRADAAKKACQRNAASIAPAAGVACECEVIIEDGASLLTAAQLSTYFSAVRPESK